MDDNGCFSATCGKQKSQDISVAKQCQIKKTVTEDVDGCKNNVRKTWKLTILMTCRVDTTTGESDGGLSSCCAICTTLLGIRDIVIVFKLELSYFLL